MRTRVHRTGTPGRPAVALRGLGRRLLSSGAVLASVVALAALPTAAGADPEAPTTPEVPEVTPEVTMVQANIYTKLSPRRFQADVREVLALEPDFVTYNEVPFRNPKIFSPEGYDYFRGEKNRFTKATPVAWRTDRWAAIDQGTFRISNWRGRPPGREVELGRRFVNWVTLQGLEDGRIVSVVSVHVAPKVRGMPDLNRPSVSRLGLLVDELAPRGPVLLGGDFNVHYRSRSRYPQDILDAHALVPTFDVMGNHFPTGDHRRATIDYVFQRGLDDLQVVEHSTVELHSDHDAVVAGLVWKTDAPASTTTVRNDPSGSRADQRAVIDTVAQGIAAAEPGAVVHLVTRWFDSVAVMRQIRRALARGVQVRLMTPERRLRGRERRAARVITAAEMEGSWARQCDRTCRRAWVAAGVARGFVMVGSPTGEWVTRYDVNRNLSGALVARASQVRVSNGPAALEQGQEMLAALG